MVDQEDYQEGMADQEDYLEGMVGQEDYLEGISQMTGRTGKTPGTKHGIWTW